VILVECDAGVAKPRAVAIDRSMAGGGCLDLDRPGAAPLLISVCSTWQWHGDDDKLTWVPPGARQFAVLFIRRC
jgi:hypothetical protein